MTRIPVERIRKGPPWWVWLLGAVTIIALLWFLFDRFVDNDRVDVDSGIPIRLMTTAETTTTTATADIAAIATSTNMSPVLTSTPDAPVATTPITITDPLLIIVAPDKPSLVGSRVRLEGVPVQAVVGDASFWVGPAEGEQLLVVLDEVPTPGDPTEGRYDINPGQTITIVGEIREFPGVEQAKAQWGVTDEARLANQQVYLHADRIEFPTSPVAATANIAETFRQFWEQNGGLAIFGYPLTEPIEENGKTVQYFERVRLELHPDNEPPFRIVPGRLGAEILALRGIPWQTQATSSGAVDGCLYFSETRHNVCNQEPPTGFLNYWSTHGIESDGQPGISYTESLALFGYPLTEPYLYPLGNGETVQVQWFERARFEWRPGNPPDVQVLLGRLGAEFLERRGQP